MHHWPCILSCSTTSFAHTAVVTHLHVAITNITFLAKTTSNNYVLP